jgi:hypothetical protein
VEGQVSYENSAILEAIARKPVPPSFSSTISVATQHP